MQTLTTKTTSELSCHVRDLCTAFAVTLIVSPRLPPDQAAAGYHTADAHLPIAQRRRAICIAPVRDETTYVVALHELGHAVSPTGALRAIERNHRGPGDIQSLREARLLLDEEEAAWEWAQHYALEWTQLMQSIQDYALSEYYNLMRVRYGILPRRT